MWFSTEQSCEVPVSVLTAAPYNLELGEGVYAKVDIRFEQNTLETPLGNGAIL